MNAPAGLPRVVEVVLLVLDVVGASVLLVVGASVLVVGAAVLLVDVVGAAVLVVGAAVVLVGAAVLLVDVLGGVVVVEPPSHTNAPPADDAWHESQHDAAEPTQAIVLVDD